MPLNGDLRSVVWLFPENPISRVHLLPPFRFLGFFSQRLVHPDFLFRVLALMSDASNISIFIQEFGVLSEAWLFNCSEWFTVTRFPAGIEITIICLALVSNLSAFTLLVFWSFSYFLPASVSTSRLFELSPAPFQDKNNFDVLVGVQRLI